MKTVSWFVSFGKVARCLALLCAAVFLDAAAFADSVRVGDFDIQESGTGAYLDVAITGYTGPGGKLAIQPQIPAARSRLSGGTPLPEKRSQPWKYPKPLRKSGRGHSGTTFL
jgi:hypothetical protein